MPVVLVPTAYRGPTRGEGEVQVEADDVLHCLQAVEEKHPGFLPLVLDANGNVHRFVKLFINGDPLDPSALDMAVGAEDRVEVLAAIAGG